MKKQLLFLTALAFASVSSFGQAVGTLPFYEPFDYSPSGARLIEAGSTVTTLKKGGLAYWWVASAAAATSSSTPVIADQPYTESFTNYPSLMGNCLGILGGSDDPLFTFTEQTSTTNVDLFSSFLYRVVTPTTTDEFISTTGNYFYAFTKTSSSGTPSNYTSCVYIRNAGAGKFNLGISETNTAGVVVWGSTAYSYDTDYLIVTRYQYDNVTNTTGLSSLWVNPTVSSVMPAATLTTSSDTTTGARIIGSSPSSGLKYIKINKDSNATNPNSFIDEIRVANTWWQALGQATAPPLATAQNQISGFSVYPNPVSNGVVYINSSNSDSKTVVVYDVLGKQLIQKVVSNGTLDVSSLNKGVYIMKVTEGAATSTQKLVIE